MFVFLYQIPRPLLTVTERKRRRETMMARQWKKNGEVTRRKADSISERAFHADTTKAGDLPYIPIE